MRLFRYALLIGLFVVLGLATYQTMLWLGVWGDPNEAQVRPLDGNDQEIALIEPATSGDEWGRLVTAMQLLEADWPKINPALPVLRVRMDKAFPALTSDVPEVEFSFRDGVKQRLRLRWYKISGEHDAASWVRKLQARSRQPLAIIGGGTSDRAVKLANVLQNAYGDDPAKQAPVFLITTATSEKTDPDKETSLISIYGQRSFRFSFTNQKMVESLLAFVQHREYPDAEKEWAQNLWVTKPDPSIPPTMHTVTWNDERYSQDMNALFQEEFRKRFPQAPEPSGEGTIPYSAGGFSHPTPQELRVIAIWLSRPNPTTPNSFLVLPTQTVRMRRFLINLRQRSAKDARNLVVFNGDAISFHSVYRDREVVWNILDLPYSLVFFAHRNPIDHAAGFSWKKVAAHDGVPQRGTSGTHDLLLYRDLFEAVLYAAVEDGKLLDDSVRFRQRLQATCWQHADPARVCNPLVHQFEQKPPAFFDADGNRQSDTGEHIVWIKPSFTGERVNLQSKISVWARTSDRDGGVWRLLEAQSASYNQSEEAP